MPHLCQACAHPSSLHENTKYLGQETDIIQTSTPICIYFLLVDQYKQMKNVYDPWQFIAMLSNGVVLPFLGHVEFSGNASDCCNWE